MQTGPNINGQLVEMIDDAVGDRVGEAVLEGAASQKGGFMAVCEVAQFDEDGRTSGCCQDVVIGRINTEAVQTCTGHRAGDGFCRPVRG